MARALCVSACVGRWTLSGFESYGCGGGGGYYYFISLLHLYVKCDSLHRKSVDKEEGRRLQGCLKSQRLCRNLTRTGKEHERSKPCNVLFNIIFLKGK